MRKKKAVTVRFWDWRRLQRLCWRYFFFYIGRMLHRFASIVLCLCLSANTLAPFSDGTEIERFSRLVEHFQEHQQVEAISFVNFLLLHYSPFSKHSASSGNDHHSLPFHAPLSSAHSAFSSYFPVIVSCTLVTPVQTFQKFLPISPRSHVFLLYTSIFQPPKIS